MRQREDAWTGGTGLMLSSDRETASQFRGSDLRWSRLAVSRSHTHATQIILLARGLERSAIDSREGSRT